MFAISPRRRARPAIPPPIIATSMGLGGDLTGSLDNSGMMMKTARNAAGSLGIEDR